MASCKDEGVYRHFEAAFVCGVWTVGVVVGGWCVMVVEDVMEVEGMVVEDMMEVEGMVVCDGCGDGWRWVAMIVPVD